MLLGNIKEVNTWVGVCSISVGKTAEMFLFVVFFLLLFIKKHNLSLHIVFLSVSSTSQDYMVVSFGSLDVIQPRN